MCAENETTMETDFHCTLGTPTLCSEWLDACPNCPHYKRKMVKRTSLLPSDWRALRQVYMESKMLFSMRSCRRDILYWTFFLRRTEK
jgi:hypothetical protein